LHSGGRWKEELITLQCLLEFQSYEDKIAVLKLMRSFSSCMRFAYQRLLEKWERKSLRKLLQQVFPLNSRYCNDAILKAEEVLESCKRGGINPVKVIFGGKALFERLKKNHLQGKKREELKRKWREKRQGTVYSRGDRAKKGNLNLRFMFIEDELYLRVNTGKGGYVYARVHRKVQRGRAEKDKWVQFIQNLLIGEATKNYKPYSVELKLKNGKVYALVSFEENLPEMRITRENGVIGIDVNASPFHLAWSEVDENGNLKEYGRISLHELLNQPGSKRRYLLWHVAHQVVSLAQKKGKAIVIENIKKLPKGRRGDGLAKLRRKLHLFVYKGLLEKIEILAKRAGIEIAKVNPAYTSVIGQFKYCPQYLINKDTAGAYVIGRRGMGFIDDVPWNYKRLLSDKEYLKCILEILKLKKEEIKKKFQDEKNKWKRNPVRAELSRIHKHIREIKNQLELLKSRSSEGNPASQERASGRNKPVRGLQKWRQKSWRVLRAAFTFPFLGRSLARDFSPLRRVLVSGDWKGVVKRLAPVPGAGATAHFH